MSSIAAFGHQQQRCLYEMSNVLAENLAAAEHGDSSVASIVLEFIKNAFVNEQWRGAINGAIDHSPPETWNALVFGIYLQTMGAPDAFVAEMISAEAKLVATYFHFSGKKTNKVLREIVQQALDDKQKQRVGTLIKLLAERAGIDQVEVHRSAGAGAAKSAAAAKQAKPRTKQASRPPCGPLVTPESIKNAVTVALMTSKYGLFRKDENSQVMCVRSGVPANKVVTNMPVFSTYGLLLKTEPKHATKCLDGFCDTKCFVCQDGPADHTSQLVEGYPSVHACQACFDRHPDIRTQFEFSYESSMRNGGAAKKRPAAAAEEGEEAAAAAEEAAEGEEAAPAAKPRGKRAAVAAPSAPNTPKAAGKVFTAKETTPQRPSAVAASAASNLAAAPPPSPLRKAAAAAPPPADDDDDLDDMY